MSSHVVIDNFCYDCCGELRVFLLLISIIICFLLLVPNLLIICVFVSASSFFVVVLFVVASSGQFLICRIRRLDGVAPPSRRCIDGV